MHPESPGKNYWVLQTTMTIEYHHPGKLYWDVDPVINFAFRQI